MKIFKFNQTDHLTHRPLSGQVFHTTIHIPSCRYHTKTKAGLLAILKCILLVMVTLVQGCSNDPKILVKSTQMCTTTLNEVYETTLLVNQNLPNYEINLKTIFAVDNSDSNAFDLSGDSFYDEYSQFSCSHSFDSGIPDTFMVLFGCSSNYAAFTLSNSRSSFCCSNDRYYCSSETTVMPQDPYFGYRKACRCLVNCKYR